MTRAEKARARILRDTARAKGRLFYRTGHQCKRGHVTKRYVSSGICVACLAYLRKSYWSDPEKRRSMESAARRWRKTPEGRASRGAAKKRYLATPHGKALSRAWKRRSRGLPEPTREEPKLCESCGRKSRRGSLCLDHDYRTHKFRGWLCDMCNRALGMLGDDAAMVVNLVRYLKRGGSAKRK